MSLVLEVDGPGLPSVLHWGPDLGDLAAAELKELSRAAVPPLASGVPDEPVVCSLLPEQSSGWQGTPGLSGHRDGSAFSTAFRLEGYQVVHDVESDGHRVANALTAVAGDDDAGLRVELTVEMTLGGLVRLRADVRNVGTGPFVLDALNLALPVPREAGEILDFTGRHLRERSPQRHPFVAGTHLRESRRARAHDSTLVLMAGQPGFGFRAGDVWGVHVAWSGNTRAFAEMAMPTGTRIVGGGELLLAGEMRLSPGDSYRSPWLAASFGRGLDELSARYHDYLRSRPDYPVGPRKVVLNTWEAVYFDQDHRRLWALAEVAARVGIERLTLDDGWFLGRRDDRHGLGDWYVDDQVWPDGLAPFIAYVRGLGMDFGLWFEPEMVNVDSMLARRHPDWILGPAGRHPVEARHQQALDLTNPAAWAYVHERVGAILTQYEIAHVKWDHNRDLIEAGSPLSGSAAVHQQTLAVYRLIDTLRREHPTVEFESCAGGGGRADLGMLERVERIWTSDCIDPLERQMIQTWTGLLVPPEMLGSHIGASQSRATGRRHELGFRAVTALFGHLGVEWDITEASEAELDQLSAWISLYKRLRGLLHFGAVIRADTGDPASHVHGVVSHDRGEAVFAVVQLATGVAAPPGRIRLPGLDDHRMYVVEPLTHLDSVPPVERRGLPPWWPGPLEMTGGTLSLVGIQVPNLQPESAVLLHVRASSHR